MTNSEQRDRLVDTITLLTIPGVGRGRFTKLVKKFGSPAAVLGASVSDLCTVTGVSRSIASSIKEECNPENARAIASRIVQLGCAVLYAGEPEYPEPLAQLRYAPPLLFRSGVPYSTDDRMVAIVGTRHASEGGRRFAHRLARELSEGGLIVVSGMAEGIDSAAHRGALDIGRKTIAVWGTPLDTVFPASNKELARQIEQNGAVYSEYFPGAETRAGNFPERNRIISGLSEAVIVVEAGKKSGALITAHCAIEQGRELFAVPGPPDSDRSTGTNNLIKQGARLITGASDVFEELPRLSNEISARRFHQLPDMTEMELRMVDLLAEGPQQVDQLCRKTELPVPELLEFLLALELKGVVQELSGKRFVLTQQS